MLSKKPLINPILVCPLIALFVCFLMIILIFQLSQLLFINHDRTYSEDMYWNRRRTPAFGQRTHRTEDQLELEADRRILADLLSDSNRNINQPMDRLPVVQRISRRAEYLQRPKDESLFKEHPVTQWQKIPTVNLERPGIIYDFVDDLSPLSNQLNFEFEGSGIDQFQVDASVISREEDDDGADFNMVPPLSRRFFAKLK